MNEEIMKFIQSIKFSDNYSNNFNNFIKLCKYLDSFDNIDEFDVCNNILKSSSNIYNIVKCVVENNINVITRGNISSLNSSEFFYQFIQRYCLDNGIDIFSLKNDCMDLPYSEFNSYYFKMIHDNPILSREEEVNLFRLYENASGDNKRIIRDRIISCNLRLVVSVAAKYNYKLPFEDLVQEGNIGLMEAIKDYDYKRGCKFSTYAFYYIKRRLILAIRNQSSNIRIPVNVHDKIRLYRSIVYNYKLKTGEKPSIDSIVSLSDLSFEDVKIIEKCLNETLSLDQMIDADGDADTDKYNFIPDESVNIEESYDMVDLNSTIFKVFEKLGFNDQQIDILVLRFGLDGTGEHTLEFIGDKYGITRERVRQIIYKLLCRIKSNRYCLELLSSYMPSSLESFNKSYLKRGYFDAK